MSELSPVTLDTLQQLDRLISASSPSDALESIHTLTSTIKRIYTSDHEDKWTTILSILSTCRDNLEFMKCICSLLSDGTMKSTVKSASMTVDDGDSTVCSFLLTLIDSLDLKPKYSIQTKTGKSTIKSFNQERKNHLKKFLSSPHDGAIIHALIDLLSPGHQSDPGSTLSVIHRNNTYAQTQALQLISTLMAIIPTIIHSQILSAPDGLNRIVDLLHNPTVEESIRNEAILLCTTMAKTNSGCARLMIFGETYEKVLQIAENEVSQDVGSLGVSSASAQIVVDCFTLAIELTKQDEMGSEVFLGSKGLVQILMKFLDLRTGQKFVYPEVESTSQEDDFDELDTILNIKSQSAYSNGNTRVQGKVPYLTEFESTVVLAALELLRVLIVGGDAFVQGVSVSDEISNSHIKKQARQTSVVSNDILSRLLIDMALYTLPPPDSPASSYVSAVPTHTVQLTALDVLAALSLDCGERLQQAIMDKPGIYLNAGVLDRLMYLVCTGDGAKRKGKEADELSMHSLGVLRCLLSADNASKLVLHTLAPPPPIDGQEGDAPSVFQKIVNTLVENVYNLIDHNTSNILHESDLNRSKRMIVGAAGALGIFLTNGAGGTTRTMLLRVPVPPPPNSELNSVLGMSPIGSHNSSLVDCLLAYLERYTNELVDIPRSTDVLVALLRLFVEWIPSSHDVISSILSAPNSITFSVLLKEKVDATKPPTVQALSGLFLGLCMEYLNPLDEIGGWTRASIVNMISNGIGISKFTQILERLKHTLVSQDGSTVVPWSMCPTERKKFIEWYTENVSIVRKKAIEELTSSDQDQDSEEDIIAGSGSISITSKDHKKFRKLISDQNMEIESLKAKLSLAEGDVAAQSLQINFFMKRLDANPSQMDDVMNEMLEKISDLEKQNASLSSEIMVANVRYENDLKSQVDEKAALYATLKTLQAEFNESEKQKSIFEEELQTLSSTYALLEAEYKKSLQIDEKKEDVVPLSSFNQLQQENSKIKNDIKAANDWMQKAVQRMDDLTQRNHSLNSEFSQSSSNYMLQIELLQNELTLQQTQSNVTIENLQHKISDLESKISSHVESSNMMISRDSEMNLRIAVLENELQKEKEMAEKSLLDVRNVLTSKDTRLMELESKLQELESLHNTSDSTDSRHLLEDEVVKLKNANEAAQEWMANAVKHHNALKKQLEEANRRADKNESFRTASDDLQNQIEVLRRERDDAVKRVKELESMANEIECLKSNVATKDLELSQRATEIDSLERNISTLSIRMNELEGTVSENEVLILNYQSKHLESDKLLSSMEDKVKSLVYENSILTNERSDHLIAIENMKASLAEFQSWTETAQHRINELEREKEDAENGLRFLEGNSKASKEIIEPLPTTNTVHQSIIETTSLQGLCHEDEIDHVRHKERVAEDVVHQQLRLQEVEKEIIYLESTVQSLQDKNSSLEIELQSKTDQLNRMIEERNNGDVSSSNVNVELESSRSSVVSPYNDIKILDEKNDSEPVIRCDDLEHTKSSLHEMEEKCFELEKALRDKDIEHLQTTNHIQNLESEIVDLRSALQTQEQSTICAISQWEKRCSELVDEIQKLTKEIQVGNEERTHVQQLKNKCSELEEKLQSMESKLSSLREEELLNETQRLTALVIQTKSDADLTISKLEERTHLLMEENKRLLLDCSGKDDLREQISYLENELSSKDLQLIDVLSRADAERENIAALKKHTLNVELLYANHVKELETAINTHDEENNYLQSLLDQRDDLIESLNQQIVVLSKDIEETRVQSEEVVKEWQESSHHQDKIISSLEETLAFQKEEAVLAIQQWESSCNKLTERIEELEAIIAEDRESRNAESIQIELEVRTDELCKLKLAYDALALRESTLAQNLSQLEQSRSQIELIDSERDSLLNTNCSLEDEVQRLNLKVFESEKSCKLQADEINHLREIQQRYEQTIDDAKKDRMLLEDELKNLKSDVMLLLSVHEQDLSDHALQKLSSKAAFHVLEKERVEIDDLRNSLNEVLLELVNYQRRERDCESCLAEARLKLSVCENELSVARSEAKAAQICFDGTIQDNVKQRLNLEERLDLLEQEQNKLNARYTRKIEKLKEEISLLKVERDRLMHTLEESENANASLVQSTVMEDVQTIDLSAEASRLRLENANLLMLISKQTLSVEKRLRDAGNSDLSETVCVSEYDLICEKFDSANAELDQIKIRNEELMLIIHDLRKVKDDTDSLKHTIAQLKKDKVDVESNLRLQLKKREDDFESLKKSYREAEERLNRFESSVQDTFTVSNEYLDGHNEALKNELEQTKTMYQDLWSEHEELLALLAQQDCEKRCLEEELLSSVGQNAIDKAMESAQSKLNDELGIN